MKILVILSLVFAVSCSKKDFFASPEAEQAGIPDSTQDIFIPKQLWDMLKGEGQENHEFTLINLDVLMKEKNPQVLKKENFVVHLPRGGGTVDMADFLTGQSGTFYLTMRAPPEVKENSEEKVYFVSRAKKRKIGNEIVGAGCRSFFEVTKKYNRGMLDKGFEVNTSNLRHASVLGGTVLFKYVVEKKIYLAQVTFVDSRIPEAQCTSTKKMETAYVDIDTH